MRTIIFLIAILNCVIISAQETNDSTQYFLKFNEANIREIDFCMNRIDGGEQDNHGIYTICLSTHANGYTMAISKIYTSWDILNKTPDFYSYIKAKPTVWYLGKSVISNKDFKFADFLITKFNNRLNINISCEKYVNELNDSVWINDYSGSRRIPANDMMPIKDIGSNSNWKPKSPTYVIEVVNNKVLSIDKKENVNKNGLPPENKFFNDSKWGGGGNWEKMEKVIVK